MKTKEIKIMHGKTAGELKIQLAQVRDELQLLRFDKSLAKLKNTRSIFVKRKEIAQVLTILKEKEIQNAKSV